MNKILVSTLILSIYAPLSTANIPFALFCPKDLDIKAVPLQGVTGGNRNFVAYSNSTFQTSFFWHFVIGPLDARSPSDALDMGNKYIRYIYGDPTPIDQNGTWYCEYNVGKNIRAIASTS